MFFSFLPGDPPEWKMILSKNGITVYNKPVGKKGLNATKSVTIFKAPIQKVVKTIKDVKLHPLLIDHCLQTEVIKETGDSVVLFYEQYDMPWPAQDRDIVVQTKVNHVSPNKTYIQSKVIHSTFKQSSEFIRITEFDAEWKIIALDENRTYIEYVALVNPEGDLPLWIVNLFLGQVPYNSMQQLHRYFD